MSFVDLTHNVVPFLALGVLGLERELLADDSGELPCGFDRLQPTIEIDGSLNARVPKQPPHRLVLAGMVFEVDTAAACLNW
jgi:hypothetical protein